MKKAHQEHSDCLNSICAALLINVRIICEIRFFCLFPPQPVFFQVFQVDGTWRCPWSIIRYTWSWPIPKPFGVTVLCSQTWNWAGHTCLRPTWYQIVHGRRIYCRREIYMMNLKGHLLEFPETGFMQWKTGIWKINTLASLTLISTTLKSVPHRHSKFPSGLGSSCP